MDDVQRNVTFLAAVLVLACLPFDTIGAYVGETVTPDDLFLSESQGLIHYSPSSPSFEIQNPSGFSALEHEESQSYIWALSKGSLFRYGTSGDLISTFHVGHGQGSQGEAPSDFAIDEQTEMVWIAVGTYLQAYSFTGELLYSENHKKTIETVKVWAENHQIAIVFSNEIVWLTQTGMIYRREQVGIRPSVKIFDAAIENTTGSLWVSANDALRRYSAAGDLEFEIKGEVEHQLSPTGMGSVWAENGANRVRLYGEGGTVLTEFYPNWGGRGATSAIRDIQANTIDESVWVISQERLSKYSQSGQLLFDEIPQFYDGVKRKFNEILLVGDTSPPKIEFLQPLDGAVVATVKPEIQLSVSDIGSGVDEASFMITGVPGEFEAQCEFLAGTVSCEPVYELEEGGVVLTATIADKSGNQSEIAEISFLVDITPPLISVDLPSNPLFTNAAHLTVNGFLSEEAGLIINGVAVAQDDDLRFESIVELVEGQNTIVLKAEDHAGNQSEQAFVAVLDTFNPEAIDEDSVAFQSTDEGIQVSGSTSTVEAGGQVLIYNLSTGEVYQVVVGIDGTFSVVIAAAVDDRISLVVQDQAGNTSTSTEMSVTLDGGVLPPDPAVVAPALDPLVSIPFHDAVSFLYQSDRPIQTGVDPNVFVAAREAVVRGKVLSVSGEPLPGVRVRIHNHPEYGETLSRADGWFDLVVNGGDRLVVSYEKPGYLPAQRSLLTKWNQYARVDDVALTTFDPVANTIQLGQLNQFQVAQGSEITDIAGTRRATLLFPPGTTATMMMNDGSVQPLEGSVTVRATEYTRREVGLEGMPAPLPMFSGYTYAVELSVDEATMAGAYRVDFNQELPMYVDNFLDFPVGTVVPLGYYDFALASWVPSQDGQVIEILVNDSEYTIDLDGDSVPESVAALEDFGISSQELAVLAERFPNGGSFWRVNVSHFTPWDCNWPYVPPEDAEQPTGCDDDGACVRSKPLDFDNPDIRCGSIIECENQVLGESIPVTGTRLSLNYRSNRVPSYDGRIVIPLTNSTIPNSLKGVTVRIIIAGEMEEFEFPPRPGLTYEYNWDGTDGYGRALNGAQVAQVKIGYKYENILWMSVASENDTRWGDVALRAFANPAVISEDSDIARGRLDFHIWKDFTVSVGQYRAADVHGLGGWSLSSVHAYDLRSGKLWKGDGTQRSVVGFNTVHGRYAGNGLFGVPVEGKNAVDSSLQISEGLAFNSAGEVYFANHRFHLSVPGIFRIDGQGLINRVASAPENELFGSIAFSEDDNLLAVQKAQYSVEDKYGGIYSIGDSGDLTRIAGIRSATGPEIGRAEEVSMWPKSIAVDSQGNIYFSESSKFIYTGGYYYGYTELNCRIKKLSKDGVVSIVGGDGGCEEVNDVPSSALDMSFNFSSESYDSYLYGQNLAFDSNDNLYIAEKYRVLKVAPDGSLSHVVDAGNYYYDQYIDQYLQSEITSIAIDNDDVLYVVQGNNGYGNVIAKLKSNGELERLAGLGVNLPSGTVESLVSEGSPALGLRSSNFAHIAASPGGDLSIVDGRVVRRIGQSKRIFSDQEILLPSDDGLSIFVFDTGGRHQRTLDAMSLETELSFTYDDSGLLSAIQDSYQNVTRIERDATSNPIAIIAPGGQRTVLAVNEAGYLASIANPAGDTHQISYSESGLLTQFQKPKGNATSSQYDGFGKLIYHSDAMGGSWSIQRPLDGTISLVSGLGRTTQYQWDYVGDIDLQHTVLHPDGTQTRSNRGDNGLYEMLSADETVLTSVKSPDSRFGMTVPIESQNIITLPQSGLQKTVSRERSTVLTDATESLLRLQSMTDAVRINNKLWETQFDAGLMQYQGTSPEGRVSKTLVDDFGKPLSTQLGDLAPRVFNYDLQGRLSSIATGISGDARTTQFKYYTSGHQNRWLVSVENTLGHVTSYSYDEAGRVIRQTLPDGGVIALAYDENGNLVSLTPPGQPPHLFAYTDVDLEEFYAPPTIAGESPVATHYVYNIDKDLELITYPSGRSVDYIYGGPGGKLSSLDYGAAVTQYSYHPTTGQLNNISSSNGESTSYQYDGSLVTKHTQSGAVSGEVGFVYDEDFDVTSVSVNGENVAYAYDDDGLLISAGELALNLDASNGLITGTSIGSVLSTRAYNEFAEPIADVAKFDGQDIYTVDYLRDLAGRIVQKDEQILGESRSINYDYDHVGRLTRVTENGETVEAYTYDGNGNRVSGNGQPGSFDEQDRLVSYGSTTYAYDVDGYLQERREAGAVTHYDYDALGNLRGVTLPGDISIAFIIDGQNRRVGKKVNGSLTQGFLYSDQLNPVAELNGAGAVVSRFVYADKANVPAYMVKGGATYRIVADHLGSPRLVINSSDGSVAQQLDYDAFGNVTLDTNPGFQPFGFAGGLYDLHTGLVRFGARDYDPETGRWTAKDPIGFAGGDSNIYAYVSNDPVNAIDPTGLQEGPWTPSSGGDVFGALGAVLFGTNSSAAAEQQVQAAAETAGDALAVAAVVVVAPEFAPAAIERAGLSAFSNPVWYGRASDFAMSLLPGAPELSYYGLAGGVISTVYDPIDELCR